MTFTPETVRQEPRNLRFFQQFKMKSTLWQYGMVPLSSSCAIQVPTDACLCTVCVCACDAENIQRELKESKDRCDGIGFDGGGGGEEVRNSERDREFGIFDENESRMEEVLQNDGMKDGNFQKIIIFIFFSRWKKSFCLSNFCQTVYVFGCASLPLHCAPHSEYVEQFGADDVVFPNEFLYARFATYPSPLPVSPRRRLLNAGRVKGI